MQAGYTGFDKRLKYLFDNATEVSATASLSSGTPIGTITVDGNTLTLYAPSGGGSNVAYTEGLASGVLVGRLSIDGVSHNLYAPHGVTCGSADPTGGDDGDFYVQISVLNSSSADIFGSPTADSGDGYEITVDESIYGTYDAHEGFGTGAGWGANGTGDNYLQYARTDNKQFAIESLTICTYYTGSVVDFQSDTTIIEGSNDGTNWTAIDTISGKGTIDTPRTIAIASSSYYKMFRFQCNSENNEFTGLKGIIATGPSRTISIVDYWIKRNGMWVKCPNYATDADIAQLQSNFQAGVDSVYNACVTKGSTPASHSLSDVVQGILDIPTSGGSIDPRDAVQVIPRLSAGDTSRVWADSEWSSYYAPWYACDGNDYDYWLSVASGATHYIVFTLTQSVIPLFIRWLGCNDGDCANPLSVSVYSYPSETLLGSFTPPNKYDDIWPIFLYSATPITAIKVVFTMDPNQYGGAGMSDIKLWGIPST